MKFACPKCNTRYSIADDKVPPGKVLKFPCKSCGNVVRLRRKEGDLGTAQILDGQAGPRPMGEFVETTRIALVSEINKLRNASTEATRSHTASPGPTPLPQSSDGGESTRVVSIEQLDQLRASSSKASEVASELDGAFADEPTTVAMQPTSDDPVEWFVLIAGKQRGPMTAKAVDHMLAKNEIDRRTFMWKSGMANWERLANLPRFAGTPAPAGQPVSSTAETRAINIPASLYTRDSGRARAIVPARVPEREQARVQPVAAAKEDETLTFPEEALDEITSSSVFNIDDDNDNVDHSHNNAIAAGLHSEESEPHTFYKAETKVVMDPRLAAQQAHQQMTREANDRRRAEASAAEIASAFQGVADEAPGFGAPPPTSDIRGTDTYAGRDPLADLDDPNALQSFDDVSQQIRMPDEHSGMGSLQDNPDYLQAPPGESTKVYMATAGIYKKRRNNRIAALIAGAAVVLIAGFIIMDQQGMIVLPGMGVVYDVAGVEDPNVDRALERTENQLASEELDPKKRAQLESLRRKLLDKTNREATAGGGKKETGRPNQGSTQKQSPEMGGSKEGVPNEAVGAQEHDMAAQLFNDANKQNVDLKLATPDAIQTPNLPDGLTQEAIYKVVNDNNTSMKLCYAEAARKGEKLAGKMEVQMTIDATGEVSGADINTPQFKSSTMGQCTVRRVKTWKFPRFNGQPVTVVFPYVLQSAF